ncbi:hypothetical protein DAEQUDRAFT_77347 [Daedalea quercina L-15889]|uniref:C2H2-type domain-containing protein n=1 Tax=Daedalea quercina L-15889 TaxID=1314783 RepID=A0A165SF90_9APHY|nr:hypothetical protein DAEQUDRAFT_77347 [Daedalea quercina L-15889]
MATFTFRLDPSVLPPVHPDSSPSAAAWRRWAQNSVLSAHSEGGVVANWLPYELAARIATTSVPYSDVYPPYAQAHFEIGEMLRDFPPVTQESEADILAAIFDPNAKNWLERLPVGGFLPHPLPFSEALPDATNLAVRREPEVKAQESEPKHRSTKQHPTTVRPSLRYACSFGCGMRFQKPKDRCRHEDTKHLMTSFKCAGAGCKNRRNRPDKLKTHIIQTPGCWEAVLSHLRAKGEDVSDVHLISPQNHLRKHCQVLSAPGQPAVESDGVNEA